jgi:hypothetical protein
MNLLAIGNDAKTSKNVKLKTMTGILYLAPGVNSGRNVCPMATAGCLEACLYTAGRGRYSNVQTGRIRKTKLWFDDRDLFIEQLFDDIRILRNRAQKIGFIPSVRLNGTSDIDFRPTGVFDQFPDVQFYDYTKVERRVYDNTQENYHLTLSRSETNESRCKIALYNGYNVAVVFRKVPETFWGYPVYPGDESDVRFMDPPGHIIGLKAKGEAKHDTSGFVVHEPYIGDFE